MFVVELFLPLEKPQLPSAAEVEALVGPPPGSGSWYPWAWIDEPAGVLRSRYFFTLAFFGIRGVGSFYYLAYALNAAPFDQAERLWAIVGLIVLMSVLLHGLTVTPAMRFLDKLHGRDPDAREKD